MSTPPVKPFSAEQHAKDFAAKLAADKQKTIEYKADAAKRMAETTKALDAHREVLRRQFAPDGVRTAKAALEKIDKSLADMPGVEKYVGNPDHLARVEGLRAEIPDDIDGKVDPETIAAANRSIGSLQASYEANTMTREQVLKEVTEIDSALEKLPDLTRLNGTAEHLATIEVLRTAAPAEGDSSRIEKGLLLANAKKALEALETIHRTKKPLAKLDPRRLFGQTETNR